eukprot:PITA_17160
MMASVIGIIFIIFCYSSIRGATADTLFAVTNNCSYTIWAASNLPNDGQEIKSGQTWNLTLPAAITSPPLNGRIWARTNCTFNESGVGSCTTGDCKGKLKCNDTGAAPYTWAGYQVYGYELTDYYYVSVQNGFNVPVSIGPLTPDGNPKCITVSCKDNITAVCVPELKVKQGCLSSCAAFPQNDLFCCAGNYSSNCPSNIYSRFFKSQCPQAYSYPEDTAAPITQCQSGRPYRVLFCP